MADIGQALERARQYRFRAGQLRTISESWVDQETRRILGRVANDYERMASYLEKHKLSETPQQESLVSCKT